MERLARRTGLSVQLLAALATVYVVWGSTYLGIKIALEGFPPMLLGATRFLLAGAVMYAVTSRSREATRPSAKQWAAAALAGTLMLVGGNGAVTWAEQRIDSGVAALLVASVPLWMALLARVFQSERLRPLAILGLFLGFVGVGVLVRPSGAGVSVVPSLVVLVGALAWAAGSIYMRRAPMPTHALQGTSMQMLAGGMVFGVIAVANGEVAQFDPAQVTGRALGALLYLMLFGSILAFSAYTWLLRNTKPSVVSTYAYVNPFVAVLLGALLLAEPVTSGMALAGVLIIAGVALIVTPTGGRTADAEPSGDPQAEPEAAPRPLASAAQLEPCEALAAD